MQTTLTTSHWRTLQEILLQQMEEKAERPVSVLLAGMPFIAQGVQTMLRGAPWISRIEILAPQDEERFDVAALDADVVFLTMPGTSRLLKRIAAHYHLLEAGETHAFAGHHALQAREAQAGYGGYGSLPRLYPSEVVAADIALRAVHRERRRQAMERGAHSEGDAPLPAPPGLALMHISGAVSRDDIALSQKFGKPVSLHIRDGARTVRVGLFAAAQGLTYCSQHAFDGHPQLFVGHGSRPDQPFSEAATGAVPVADPALWQMLSEQTSEDDSSPA